MPPHPALLWVARALAVVAAVVAAYLLWVALASESHVAGCGNEGAIDCDHVLSSRWSHILGVPVSLPAVVIYTLVLLALFGASPDASEQNQTYAWRLLLALTLIAGLGGLWFIGLQVFVLHSFCPYCLVVHSCGLLLLGFVLGWGPLRLRTARSGQVDPLLIGPSSMGALLAGSLLFVLLLAGTQALVAPIEKPMEIAETYSPPAAVTGTRFRANDDVSADRPRDDLPSDDQAGDDLPGDVPPSDDVPGDGPPGDEVSGDEPSANASDEPVKPNDSSFDPELDRLLSNSNDSPKRENPSAAENEIADEPPARSARPVDRPVVAARRHRRVSMLDNAIRLDAGEEPVVGSLDANCLVVEMFDYTCPHCRVLHRYMHQAHERYGDQLAVVLICVPMNTSCNKHVKTTGSMHVNACIYARLAMAVWMRAPEKFLAFHDWLMDPDTIPTPRDARSEADRILGENSLGESILDEALSDPALDAHLTANTNLYKEAGGGVIPKIIYDRITADGEPASAQRLFDVFEKNMGLRPVTPEQ